MPGPFRFPYKKSRSAVVICAAWLLLLPVGAGAEPTALERDVRALLKPQGLGGIAVAFGAAGLAHGLDDEFSGHLDHDLVAPLLNFGNAYLDSKHSLGSAAGVWLATGFMRRDGAHAASAEVLRALVLANAMVAPLKIVVGRERPDGSNEYSFPSGHSANAFAISTVLGRRYGRKVGLPFFVLAGFVPVARIHDRHHFFSDVVAGSVLGVVAGWAVERGDGEKLVLAPGYARGLWMLQVGWRY